MTIIRSGKQLKCHQAERIKGGDFTEMQKLGDKKGNTLWGEGKYGKQRYKKLTLPFGDKRMSVSIVIIVQRNEMSYLCPKLMDNLGVLKKERW